MNGVLAFIEHGADKVRAGTVMAIAGEADSVAPGAVMDALVVTDIAGAADIRAGTLRVPLGTVMASAGAAENRAAAEMDALGTVTAIAGVADNLAVADSALDGTVIAIGALTATLVGAVSVLLGTVMASAGVAENFAGALTVAEGTVTASAGVAARSTTRPTVSMTPQESIEAVMLSMFVYATTPALYYAMVMPSAAATKVGASPELTTLLVPRADQISRFPPEARSKMPMPVIVPHDALGVAKVITPLLLVAPPVPLDVTVVPAP